MRLQLLICVLIKTNGEWIKIEHMSPTEFNLFREDSFSTALPEFNNVTVVLKNESIQSVSGTMDDESEQPFVFNSHIKDTLLKTNWLLSQQEDRSLSGKLKFLQNIKQHLLQGIWEQSKILWRRKTTEPRSTFGFPSMEGALITIAFLTFAVFLIKIVQQFIQGLQGLAPNTVGLQMPTIQGARHKREYRQFTNEKAARIFQYLDDFKIQYG